MLKRKRKLSISAEKITAFLDNTKNANITDLEAIGNVIIINQNTTAKSNSLHTIQKPAHRFKNQKSIYESKKFRLLSKNFISFDDINKIANSERSYTFFAWSNIYLCKKSVLILIKLIIT